MIIIIFWWGWKRSSLDVLSKIGCLLQGSSLWGRDRGLSFLVYSHSSSCLKSSNDIGGSWTRKHMEYYYWPSRMDAGYSYPKFPAKWYYSLSSHYTLVHFFPSFLTLPHWSKDVFMAIPQLYTHYQMKLNHLPHGPSFSFFDFSTPLRFRPNIPSDFFFYSCFYSLGWTCSHFKWNL